MKDSLKKEAESLCLTGSEIARLRDRSREWLETVYHQNDEHVARLFRSKNKLVKQARRFIADHGVEFFARAVQNGTVDDLQDPRLVLKVVRMMSSQAEYKCRKLKKRKDNEYARKDAMSDTEGEPADTASESHEPQSLEDLDYEPSNATLDTPRLKRHNTRVNTQPGMPLCQSIETNESSTGSQYSAKMGVPKAVAGSVETIERYDEAEEATGQREGDHRSSGPTSRSTPQQRTASRYDTITIPSVVSTRNQCPFYDSQIDSRSTLASGVTNGVPTHAQSRNKAAVEPEAEALQFSFEADAIDFDQFLDPDELRSTNSDWTIINKSSPSVRTNRIHAPRCEQTPPSSARSTFRARHSSYNDIDDVDSKSMLRHLTEDPTRSTDGGQTSIFITADHYKVIPNESAAHALQCLFNVLNDKSRRYQKLAQRTTGPTFEKREAERKAIWMCGLLSELKDSRQIWDQPLEIVDAIEIL